MKLDLASLLRAFALTVFALCGPAAAAPEDAACVRCHKDYEAFASAPFGCAKCHPPADTATVPHKNLGFFNGKIATVSRSCLSCHDKPEYAKIRHRQLGLACTACHNAHAAKHGQLATEDSKTLCFSCHEKSDFEAKVVHRPVARARCTDCHAVHATEHAKLLTEPPTAGCLECHEGVKDKPHATINAAGKGHPLGGEKPGLKDPARPDQPFYCGSCHDPHMSPHPNLMRFDLRSPTGFCQQCHKI
jgi:predicted CXXCH cytochrome family protein